MVKSLKLLDDHLFTALHPFNRENLFYEVLFQSPITFYTMVDRP